MGSYVTRVRRLDFCEETMRSLEAERLCRCNARSLKRREVDSEQRHAISQAYDQRDRPPWHLKVEAGHLARQVADLLPPFNHRS